MESQKAGFLLVCCQNAQNKGAVLTQTGDTVKCTIVFSWNCDVYNITEVL